MNHRRRAIALAGLASALCTASAFAAEITGASWTKVGGVARVEVDGVPLLAPGSGLYVSGASAPLAFQEGEIGEGQQVPGHAGGR